MTEIERKFLVTSTDFKHEATSFKTIVQGFLNTHPERTVRIRISGEKGYFTVKGLSNDSGTTRLEWEKEISAEDAKLLFPLCEKGIIEKIRYQIPIENHVFEVDEFFGENLGLIIAEIELQEENEIFPKPEWLGKEVTGEKKYYNSQLSKNPFTTW